ncbi:MAG: HAD-IIB family hydrolase [Candidatus Aminicenantes bacterium]|jgi:sucrose-phosphate synthase
MKNNKLYIQMFSIHGLLRGKNLELGRDADTGGQVLYVTELAKHLSQLPNIERIDLFTRLISDKTTSDDYSVPIESVSEKFRIIRIRCGGLKYMRKELLWSHLDEYVDKIIKFIKRQNRIPDIFHGHYADAGYVANVLSQFFGSPFVFTGHSLGQSKLQRLKHDGMKEDDIIKKFKIDHRISVEENLLENADLVITSTHQEIQKQYGLYHNKDVPNYRVIPPGLNLEKFYPFYHNQLPDFPRDEQLMYAQASLLEELNRFLIHPDKPLILTLCRPDKRKNISGLVKAYGEDRELQAIANLAIFAGIRKNIVEMEDNERGVLTDMLLLMDKYDLYGKMAIPKTHEFEHEVPELYRLTAEKRGVFVNSALTEPFGLTLIEAGACGLPLVATNDGGPQDILANLKNGILVDPTNTEEISQAIIDILTNTEKWKQFSKNGVMNAQKHYTWEAHVKKYTNTIKKLAKPGIKKDFQEKIPRQPIGARLTRLNYFLITDIDNTLLGGEKKDLTDFFNILKENCRYFGFGVATGRSVDSAAEILKKHDVPQPDLIISSVGTEIYYGKNLFYDPGWDAHLSNKWERKKIQKTLDQLDFLTYQEDQHQRKFKISYYMEPSKDHLTEIHDLLVRNKCRYNLVYSGNKYLDIIPYRASKGKAIRYISYKWEIPINHIMTCGDSGNDEEMLRGELPGVVVGNYEKEMEPLKGLRKIYFAKNEYAAGIIEGLEHYGLLREAKQQRRKKT